MRQDSIAREPEVFGNAFVDHFGATRQNEVNLWNKAVTDWESES
jgi:glutamine synthetase